MAKKAVPFIATQYKKKPVQVNLYAKGGAKAKRVLREATSGTFILGEKAFRKISAVEGIKPSKRLTADLMHVKNMHPKKRRDILAKKYGKKK